MSIAALARSLVGCLVLSSSPGKANGPLLGWEELTFGMDQSTTESSAKSGGGADVRSECWNQIGRPPYDQCFVSFSKSAEGIEWFVLVFFLPHSGLAKIELTTHREIATNYKKLRQSLAARYGIGRETDRSRLGECEDLSQARSAGMSTRYMNWIAPKGFSYWIAAEGGTVEMISKEDGLCWNSPADVRSWFKEENRTSKYLRPTLSIVYERRPINLDRDRSDMRQPIYAQKNPHRLKINGSRAPS